MSENNSKVLPMNWWNWWKYVIFPLSIFISIGSIIQYNEVDFSTLNMFGWTIVIVHLALTILLCVNYGMFLTKKEQSFNIFITYLFLQPAWNVFTTTLNNNVNNLTNNITQLVITGLISYGLICGICAYPNYIYFKKRKDYFTKKEEQQSNSQGTEDEHLKNIINTIEKEKNIETKKAIKENNEEKKDVNKQVKNKKYCTKCGKIVESEWNFCNYCGNKLK